MVLLLRLMAGGKQKQKAVAQKKRFFEDTLFLQYTYKPQRCIYTFMLPNVFAHQSCWNRKRFPQSPEHEIV